MRVRWTAAAYADLRAVREHIAADSPAAARRVANAIIAATRQLRRFPESGRVGRIVDTRELVVTTTPYVVVYRMHQGQVELLHVIDGAQEWPPSGEEEGDPSNGLRERA